MTDLERLAKIIMDKSIPLDGRCWAAFLYAAIVLMPKKEVE